MASSIFLLSLAGMAAAQSAGTQIPEEHPKLPMQKCTADGCETVNTSVVIDSELRLFHAKDSDESCWDEEAEDFNKELCPDAETCAANCVLEGVDYAAKGITTEGNSMTLTLFDPEPNEDGSLKILSPRVYLFDEDNDAYFDFRVVGKEFSFDVDMTKLPCGTNGALYLDEMRMDGDSNEYNTAGPKYGTGYCDAQCPQLRWVEGKANMDKKYGYCCAEMDIWEANEGNSIFTPHSCNITGPATCEEPFCGQESRYDSYCDKDGCDYNAYRLGNPKFYSPGAEFAVDTSKVVTVVTQFIKSDYGEDLVDIRRLYVQDGKVIANPNANYEGIDPKFDSNNDDYCAAAKETFNATNAYANQGGQKGMGDSLNRGHVLAMSVWFDQTQETYMKWLDGTFPPDEPETPGAKRGPCPAGTGSLEDLTKNHADTRVVFSNLKFGDIGTTYKGEEQTYPPPYGGRHRRT